MPDLVKQITLGPQQRYLHLVRESINENDRTIELSFSSEQPVERWFGMEILGHNPDEVDLSLISDGAPFLMDHRSNDQRGVIESVSIDQKRGKAVIRLSRSDRGEELLQDMKDGIRQKISVGYELLEIIHIKRDENGLDWYRATKWRPYEISSVAMPADETVGVGRAAEKIVTKTLTVQLREGTMPKPTANPETHQPEQRAQLPVQQPSPTQNAQTPDPVEAERTRAAEITSMGQQFGMMDQAMAAIRENVSVQQFQADVLTAVREKRVKPAGTDMSLDLTEKELRRYSLVNAVRASITKNWKNAGLEREVSNALADKMGKDARGFYVNYQVLAGLGQQSRAANNSTAASLGGELVATELWSNEFIELLRPQSVAAALGVRFATGLVGDVDIPKRLSGSSFYWIDEDAEPGQSGSTFGVVKMTPKTIAGAVQLTRRLMLQTTPDIDLLLRDDLLTGLGLAMDKAIYLGSGTGAEPKGIVNQTGVHAVPVTDWDWATIVNFETLVSESNASGNAMAYLSRPSLRGTLKTTPKVAGQAVFLHEGGDVNGYPHVTTTQMPAGAMLFGDHSQALCGLWGALDLNVDEATKAASGGTVLRVFQDADVAVRHAQAFAYGVKA